MKPVLVRMLAAVWLVGWAVAQAQQAPAEPPYSCQKDVWVPMRDGVRLSANVFLPKDGGPFPVILMRTPYGKGDEKFGEAKRYCPAGYALVVQDCRGRGQVRRPMGPILARSARRVRHPGMDRPPALVQRPGGHCGWVVCGLDAMGGCTGREPLLDLHGAGGAVDQPVSRGAVSGWRISACAGFRLGRWGGRAKIPPAKLQEAFWYLPLRTWDEQGDKRVFFMRDWVAHPTYDDYWRARGIDDRFDQVTVPVLNVGGWYDIFSKATLDQIARVRASSTNRLARRNQFVVMGPWAHGVGGQKVGELDFGPEAKLDLGKLQFDWFEYWLKDKETGVQDWPALRLFVMGENRWRTEHEWPLARTRFTPWYLHSGGQANSRHGNGTLSLSPPEAEPPDRFSYDPTNPVPTRGGNNLVGPPAGPFDQKLDRGSARCVSV
jgi:predicted acyl esterase